MAENEKGVAAGSKSGNRPSPKLLSWKFLIIMIAAVSVLIAVFTAYLVPYFLHEEISPYIGVILVGRALGIFVVLVLGVTLTKRYVCAKKL